MAAAKGASMIISSDAYWYAQLDEEASRRRDQPSFHVFAEGAHADVRGQLHRITNAAPLSLPTGPLPHHVFIVLGVSGEATAHVRDRTVELRPFSQLVILPGVACRIETANGASVEVLSLLSAAPTATSNSYSPGASARLDPPASGREP